MGRRKSRHSRFLFHRQQLRHLRRPGGGPGGDLTVVNVVFSIGEDTQEGTDPINIDWEDAEAVMTVIICNSSFDVNGDPSIEIDADGGLVDLYLANNVFNSDNDFELE